MRKERNIDVYITINRLEFTAPPPPIAHCTRCGMTRGNLLPKQLSGIRRKSTSERTHGEITVVHKNYLNVMAVGRVSDDAIRSLARVYC